MEATDFKKKTPGRPEIALIGSNLLAIALAVVLQYDFAIVIWSYWLESIIIGFYTVVTMMLIGMRDRMPIIGYIAGAGFFIVHYGMFHAAYMVFLVSMPTTEIGWDKVPFVLLTGGIFLLSHGVSFIEHALRSRKKEAKGWEQEIGGIFFGPYRRVVPMHMTIIASGFVMVLISGQLAAQILLVVLMVLKTGVDLASHRAKHSSGA